MQRKNNCNSEKVAHQKLAAIKKYINLKFLQEKERNLVWDLSLLKQLSIYSIINVFIHFGKSLSDKNYIATKLQV